MKAINEILNRASLSGAPITALANKKPASYRVSALGQTHAPAKVLKDGRTGRRISLQQAKQIVEKYERNRLS